MDIAKVLHMTCNIDVRHAVVQLFIVLNVSFLEAMAEEKSENVYTTINYYYSLFIRCVCLTSGSQAWPEESRRPLWVEERCKVRKGTFGAAISAPQLWHSRFGASQFITG
uniref:Uncharacterized protein n=1 Tax=Romanomermis culicivorax TaxID=13658 RepID=A0A915HZT7_ROMCU